MLPLFLSLFFLFCFLFVCLFHESELVVVVVQSAGRFGLSFMFVRCILLSSGFIIKVAGLILENLVCLSLAKINTSRCIVG